MANTSIVTESARAAAAVNVLDYAASIRDHINGGWEKHHQVGVVVGAFPIPHENLALDQESLRQAHEVKFPWVLRLQVTNPGVTDRDELVEVLVPVTGWEEASSGASTPPGAPVINYDSADTALSNVALASAASTTLKVALTPPDTSPGVPMTYPVVYQWRKDLVNIPGANSRQLTVTMSSSSAVGDYQCLVAGFGGITYSRVARITHA